LHLHHLATALSVSGTALARTTILTTALLLSACAQAPLQVAPNITVINRSGQQLTELRYRPCNSPSEPWQTFASGPLAAGRGIALEFPLPCSDLSALYAYGRSAGNQSNVKEQYPFRWDIY